VDDILRLGGPIAGQLARVTANTDAFRFDASSAPSLPPSAATDRIVIVRGQHGYNGYWRADWLGLYAARQTLRALGVIVLASLFAQPDGSTDITRVRLFWSELSGLAVVWVMLPTGEASVPYGPEVRSREQRKGSLGWKSMCWRRWLLARRRRCGERGRWSGR
jgi:hypothetical protein